MMTKIFVLLGALVAVSYAGVVPAIPAALTVGTYATSYNAHAINHAIATPYVAAPIAAAPAAYAAAPAAYAAAPAAYAASLAAYAAAPAAYAAAPATYAAAPLTYSALPATYSAYSAPLIAGRR